MKSEEAAAVAAELAVTRREAAVSNNRRLQKAMKIPLELDETSPLDALQAQQMLVPGTTLISYWVNESRIRSQILQRSERLQSVSTEISREDLEGLIERYRGATLQGNAGSIERLGRELYNQLLRPLEGYLENTERLLIVSDGPLRYLSFGALIRPNGEFVIEWKPVFQAHSASVFALLKSRRSRRKREGARNGVFDLVAFGDPDYTLVQGKRRSISAEGDVGFVKPDEISEVRLRSAIDRGVFDWHRLQATRREVERIAALFPRSKVKVLLGREATEERAMALAGDARILHFAAHGHLDERLPLNSAIVLSIPDGLPPDRENGLLQVWEILEQLNTEADLVVLSACQTALGKDLGGDGLLGLTRAFQLAGARTVLASLWRVEDGATAALMVAFYRYYTAEVPAAEALRLAQLEILKRYDGATKYSSPYLWAGFQVYGDWM